MFPLLNFGGIGLFTCKMQLYTYYMQPIEANATKLCGIKESTNIWQRSLTVGGGKQFPLKLHVLLLNREQKKIRQVR